jgi:homoserine O-succinyltransferase
MPSLPVEEHRPRPLPRAKSWKAESLNPARPLRLGVLSLSREAETSLIEPLSRAALPVHPIRIHLGTTEESSASLHPATNSPVSFTRAILEEPLDGLVLAGTPEQNDDPASLPRWRELTEILEYARGFVPSTLGLGAGALVIAKVLGLEVEPLEQELRGLVPQRALREKHSLLNGSSEVFFSTEARRFRITDASVERAVAEKRVTPLAYSRDAGVSIFESADRRYVAHLGRPERTAARPAADDRLSAFFDSARESARAHAAAFFAAWVRQVHELGRKGRPSALPGQR